MLQVFFKHRRVIVLSEPVVDFPELNQANVGSNYHDTEGQNIFEKVLIGTGNWHTCYLNSQLYLVKKNAGPLSHRSWKNLYYQRVVFVFQRRVLTVCLYWIPVLDSALSSDQILARWALPRRNCSLYCKLFRCQLFLLWCLSNQENDETFHGIYHRNK